MWKYLCLALVLVSPLSLRAADGLTITATDGGAIQSNSVDFGEVAVNDMVYRDMQLTNNTQADITNLQLSIGGDNEFSGETDCAATVAVGASCRVRLEFRPTRIGSFVGAFYIAADGGINQTIDLTGWGK